MITWMDFKRLFTKHLKVGMRVIKTVIAVFICCLIDFFRGVLPLQSTMAAIICIQPDTENTIHMAVSRILATLLGSITATLLLVIAAATGIGIPSITFYLIASLSLIPLITITVRMGWPSATALTCMIFLSIALGYNHNSNLLMSSLNRMFDTLLGILVALPINAFLPNRLGSTPNDTAEKINKPSTEQCDENQ